MRTPLPRWARLRSDLSKGQRIIAISAIIFSALVSVLCIVTIFALADLGHPALLHWIVWFLFGIGPIAVALEEYGAGNAPAGTEDETAPAETEASGETSAPPRLRLIHSPKFDNDQPYDQEADHAHHVRTTG